MKGEGANKFAHTLYQTYYRTVIARRTCDKRER